MTEQRFLTSYGEAGSNAPGLVLGSDGLPYLVRPDGTRALIEAPPTVAIDLGGSEAFEIAASPTEVSAGYVTFVVHNIGGFTHECLIVKTDLSASDLVALAPQGGQLDESTLDVRADSGDVPAGTYVRFDVVLPPGHYVLVCNEAGHAHLGMATDFDVTQLAGTLADVSYR